MGTILASAIINGAAEILQDENNVRWTRAKLLAWLMAGMREIVVLRPSAYVVNGNATLVAGTKQTLPAGGILFMDMNRNMGVNGTTPGRVPRFIEKKIIDAENPNWHADKPSATVLHFTYDARDPTHYYVYPRQPDSGQGKVEILYSAAPPAIAEGDAIPLDDTYANSLNDYLLYRAYSKDPVNADKATAYYKTFIGSVATRPQLDAESEPSKDKEG